MFEDDVLDNLPLLPADEVGICPICKEEGSSLTEPIKTSCAHTYCWPCIYQHVRKSRDIVCPICRHLIVSVHKYHVSSSERSQSLENLDIPSCPGPDEAPFADLMMGEQAQLDLGHGNEQDGNEEMVEVVDDQSPTPVLRRSLRDPVPSQRLIDSQRVQDESSEEDNELPEPPYQPLFPSDHHVNENRDMGRGRVGNGGRRGRGVHGGGGRHEGMVGQGGHSSRAGGSESTRGGSGRTRGGSGRTRGGRGRVRGTGDGRVEIDRGHNLEDLETGEISYLEAGSSQVRGAGSSQLRGRVETRGRRGRGRGRISSGWLNQATARFFPQDSVYAMGADDESNEDESLLIESSSSSWAPSLNRGGQISISRPFGHSVERGGRDRMIGRSASNQDLPRPAIQEASGEDEEVMDLSRGADVSSQPRREGTDRVQRRRGRRPGMGQNVRLSSKDAEGRELEENEFNGEDEEVINLPRGAAFSSQPRRERTARVQRGRGRRPVMGENVEGREFEEDDFNGYNKTRPEHLVPGSNKTYEEVMISFTRDFIINKQLAFSRLGGKWTTIVRFIREVHPAAWPSHMGEGVRDPAQASKVLKKNMQRIVQNHREKRKFIRSSGMSSPQQTVLEKYVDEIILLDPPIEEMEYMANNNPVRSQNAAEKRRHGQLIREAALTNVGTSRDRVQRIESSFKNRMSNFNVDLQSNLSGYMSASQTLASEIGSRTEGQVAKDVEARRDRQRELERQERQDTMAATLQTAQLHIMREMFSKPFTAVSSPEIVLPSVGVSAAAEPGTSLEVVQPQLVAEKRIQVYYMPEEQVDSEEFPTQICVRNISELKEQLGEVCGIKNINKRVVKIILNHSEVIVSISNLIEGREYCVKKRVKPDLFKIYVDEKT